MYESLCCFISSLTLSIISPFNFSHSDWEGMGHMYLSTLPYVWRKMLLRAHFHVHFVCPLFKNFGLSISFLLIHSSSLYVLDICQNVHLYFPILTGPLFVFWLKDILSFMKFILSICLFWLISLCPIYEKFISLNVMKNSAIFFLRLMFVYDVR